MHLPKLNHRIDGAFHIQSVNASNSPFKGWMIPFHSVATKYLANYLGWRRLLEHYKTQLKPLISLKEAQGYTGVRQLT